MIKNVIFDLGRVLVNYEPEKYIDSIGYSEEIKQKLLKSLFYNDIWNEFDRGTLTYEQGIKLAAKKEPDIENELKCILRTEWFEMHTLKKETDSFLKELKQDKYKIYILSNFEEHCFKYLYNKYDFFKLVDGMVISYSVKVIKPELEIYNILLEKYNLIPKECVFIDDREENILAGEKLGIKGIVFTNIDDVKNKFFDIINR